MSFKIGQRVKCRMSIARDYGGPIAGQVYTITSISERQDYIGFELPGYNWPHNSDGLTEKIRAGVYPNWGIDCFAACLPKVKHTGKIY